MTTVSSVSLEDINAAANRIRGVITRTPMLESHELNERCGGRVLVKAEVLQRTGAFKLRGAFSFLSSLSEEERRRGVTAFSSGNHAQAVALSAQMLQVKATVFMPQDAPNLKIQRTKEYGASVVLYDRKRDDRDALAAQFVARTGSLFVSPYDDPMVIAGQGTIGLEILQQTEELGATIDLALVPCGGGGLCAGIATALRGIDPSIEVFAVEPKGFDDTGRSLAEGASVSNDPTANSICDALLASRPGEVTFPINQKLLAGAISVTDDEVRYAMRWAFEYLKLVVEPGGAVALAALLAGHMKLEGRIAAMLLSGGNADPGIFLKVLSKRHSGIVRASIERDRQSTLL